jgi:glycerophosphoryl diester phosphodiesterase
VAGSLLATVLALPSVPATAVPEPPLPATFKVEAHRGGPVLGAPENTAALFRLAVAAGVERIELDVQVTSDDVVVVSHNDTLPERCTSAGERLHTLTWAQVQQVRCSGEPIPSLAEAISIIKDSGTTMNLEVKTWDEGKQPAASQRHWARLAVGEALDAGMRDQLVVSTFGWRTTAATIKALDAGVYLLAMDRAAYVKQPGAAVYSNVREAARRGADGYLIAAPYAGQGQLDLAHDLGLDTALFDWGGRADQRFAVANGQEYLGYDDPAAAAGLQASLALQPLQYATTDTALPAKTVLNRRLARDSTALASVIGSRRVPATAQRRLLGATLAIRITATGKGTLAVGPRGGRAAIEVEKLAFSKGTHTYRLTVPPGDYGQLRLGSSRKATARVRVVGYTSVDF